MIIKRMEDGKGGGVPGVGDRGKTGGGGGNLQRDARPTVRNRYNLDRKIGGSDSCGRWW